MAKLDSDEIVTSGTSARGGSLKPRRFPWRLWLYALAMTAGAGAGGYYTWQNRHRADAAETERDACKVESNKQKVALAGLDAKQKQLDDCVLKFADARKRAEGYEALNATLAGGGAKPGIAAAPAGSPAAVIDDIQKQLAKPIEAHQVTATARRGSFVLTLAGDALFTAGTAELTEAGKTSVLEVGFTLKRITDRRFQITGHLDDAPLKAGAFKDSLELSAARAVAVTRALTQAGVDARNLVAAGAGDGDPVGKDAAKNRRIEIALLPAAAELAALPASLGADTAAAAAAPVPAPVEPAKPAAPTPTPAPTPAK